MGPNTTIGLEIWPVQSWFKWRCFGIIGFKRLDLEGWLNVLYFNILSMSKVALYQRFVARKARTHNAK